MTGKQCQKMLAAFLCAALFLSLWGCGKKLEKEKGKDVEYTICQEQNLPGMLKKTLEDKKEKPGTFTWKNSMYTYLVVCYGRQKYSGYSIRVEECTMRKESLYLRTQLIGPSAGEPVTETETFPWIVVRCDQTEAICIIEP